MTGSGRTQLVTACFRIVRGFEEKASLENLHFVLFHQIKKRSVLTFCVLLTFFFFLFFFRTLAVNSVFRFVLKKAILVAVPVCLIVEESP